MAFEVSCSEITSRRPLRFLTRWFCCRVVRSSCLEPVVRSSSCLGDDVAGRPHVSRRRRPSSRACQSHGRNKTSELKRENDPRFACASNSVSIPDTWKRTLPRNYLSTGFCLEDIILLKTSIRRVNVHSIVRASQRAAYRYILIRRAVRLAEIQELSA